MVTQTYAQAARHLLEQASAELAQDDVRQASEKGWGAAAQMVKAVAEQRGWQHRQHAALFAAVSRLVDETAALFAAVSRLVDETGYQPTVRGGQQPPRQLLRELGYCQQRRSSPGRCGAVGGKVRGPIVVKMLTSSR